MEKFRGGGEAEEEGSEKPDSTAPSPCDAASFNVHRRSSGTRYNPEEETNYRSHEQRLLRITLASMLLVSVT
jgi:hypothetical protein